MSADRYYSSMPVLFRLHPAFMSLAVEFRAVSVRLLAYVCGIGLLALIAADVFAKVALEPADTAISPRDHAWAAVPRPQPAFAAPVADFSAYSESYEILRHPQGGRRDIIRWSASAPERPLAQIELYRPGTELTAFKPPIDAVAAHVAQGRPDGVQTAGVIEAKFGPVALFRFSGQTRGQAHRCIGFAHSFETPRLQLSGWSCQGDTPQLQRQAIACMLDRLTMLSAGNDPKFAELFARAELRRAGCGHHAQPDWITATNDPHLRGSFALKRN